MHEDTKVVRLTGVERLALWVLLNGCPKKGLADQRLCIAAWEAFRLDDVVQQGPSASITNELGIPTDFPVNAAHVARLKQANEEMTVEGPLGLVVPKVLDKLDAAL